MKPDGIIRKFYVEHRDGNDMVFAENIDIARDKFNSHPHNERIGRQVIKIWEAK